jgi:hypothetical protein
VYGISDSYAVGPGFEYLPRGPNVPTVIPRADCGIVSHIGHSTSTFYFIFS